MVINISNMDSFLYIYFLRIIQLLLVITILYVSRINSVIFSIHLCLMMLTIVSHAIKSVSNVVLVISYTLNMDYLDE